MKDAGILALTSTLVGKPSVKLHLAFPWFFVAVYTNADWTSFFLIRLIWCLFFYLFNYK